MNKIFLQSLLLSAMISSSAWAGNDCNIQQCMQSCDDELVPDVFHGTLTIKDGKSQNLPVVSLNKPYSTSTMNVRCVNGALFSANQMTRYSTRTLGNGCTVISNPTGIPFKPAVAGGKKAEMCSPDWCNPNIPGNNCVPPPLPAPTPAITRYCVVNLFNINQTVTLTAGQSSQTYYHYNFPNYYHSCESSAFTLTCNSDQTVTVNGYYFAPPGYQLFASNYSLGLCMPETPCTMRAETSCAATNTPTMQQTGGRPADLL